MDVSVINNLTKVQLDLSKLKDDKDPEIKLFIQQFKDFQLYLKKYNLDLEYFYIFPYDEVKYHQLILSKGDLVFQVIDDLTGHVLTQNSNWTRDHYFISFNSLELTKVCSDSLNHNFTPFNLHLQKEGFYLEAWESYNIVNYIKNSMDNFLFLPLYQDSGKLNQLHVSLIIIEIKDQKVYHWDPNGEYSVFYDQVNPLKDIIPGLMELTISNFFAQKEFQDLGYNFKYIPNSDLPLYNFNTPTQKYSFDKGDCFVHLLLVPYLITRLRSLDNVVNFYKNMNKTHQSFLIYNFSSYLTLKYQSMIAPEHSAVNYIEKHNDNNRSHVQPKDDKKQILLLLLTNIINELKKVFSDLMDNIPNKDHPTHNSLISFKDQLYKLENLKSDL
jgi:hypothetical protein